MSNAHALRSRVRQVSGVVAVLFGLATLAAGVSVLAARFSSWRLTTAGAFRQ